MEKKRSPMLVEMFKKLKQKIDFLIHLEHLKL
jgi:hypothetical protein